MRFLLPLHIHRLYQSADIEFRACRAHLQVMSMEKQGCNVQFPASQIVYPNFSAISNRNNNKVLLIIWGRWLISHVMVM